MAAIASYRALEEVLRGRHPTLNVVLQEWSYGYRLKCTIHMGDVRYAWTTPDFYDYRSQPMEFWLHRFSELIKGKLK